MTEPKNWASGSGKPFKIPKSAVERPCVFCYRPLRVGEVTACERHVHLLEPHLRSVTSRKSK